MQGLLDHTKTVRCSNAVAAGTTDIEPAGTDCAGFGSVLFIGLLGALTDTAVTSIKLQGSDDNATFVDLTGTAVTIADTDDNKVVQAELIRPVHRYNRMFIDRGTANAVLDGIIAILSNPHQLPPTQTVLGNEQHVSPAEGTA